MDLFLCGEPWKEHGTILFGIKGFALSDVILEFGFNPTMCAVTACISDLGFGMGMTFADSIIKFDGNAASPDFWDIFLYGFFENKARALTVCQVIDEWNSIHPEAPISKYGIPPAWAINEVSFYFAPVSGMFGPITYAAGFGITGNMIILDMNIFLSLNCTDSAGFACNFAFDVTIPPKQFEDLLKHEVELLYPPPMEYVIFSLKYVDLSAWAQRDVAAGLQPRFRLGIEIFDAHKYLDFHVPQGQLGGSFHDFFIKWLKSLF